MPFVVPIPPTYKLLVGGNDLSKYAEQTGWSITEQFSRQGATMKITLWDEYSGAQPTFVPQAVSPISLVDQALGVTLFSGITGVPQLDTMGPNLNKWSIDCRDWTYLADGAIVVGDFLGLSCDAILKILITQANCGIVPGLISPGPVVPRVQINWKTLTAAAQELATLAGQTSDFGWFVDVNRAMNFYAFAQAAAPTVTLTDGDVLPSGVIARYSPKFSYKWDGQNMRTRAIVRGASYSGNRTDTWRGDGHTTQWVLTLDLNTSGATPTLLVNGSAVNLWIAGTSTSAQPAGGYELVNSAAGPWALQVYGTQGAPSNGTVLQLTYPFQAPVIAQADDLVSQAQYVALPNRGIFAMYTADSTLVTLTTAQQRAIAEIQQYSTVQERLTVKTAEGFSGHIRAGDQIQFVSGRVPDSQNGYLTPLNDTFIVVASTITGAAAGYRTYALTAVRT